MSNHLTVTHVSDGHRLNMSTTLQHWQLTGCTAGVEFNVDTI